MTSKCSPPARLSISDLDQAALPVLCSRSELTRFSPGKTDGSEKERQKHQMHDNDPPDKFFRESFRHHSPPPTSVTVGPKIVILILRDDHKINTDQFN